MHDVTVEMSSINDKLDTIRALFYDVVSINPDTAPSADLARRSDYKQSLYYAVNDLKNFADHL